ncbi:Rab guanyl-nucleotide exchange factor [Mycena sanguinolenta]|uniref:Rab guanyl-nucleotide exchange factor n=1 Tax=Mycena sanguinolenta TaxID=230812 RepID=A0A8H6ZDD5_9AGAR|nr:Rab guanyl-nucleotide exchange factor [Mycena sanguinolenta]
MAPFEFPRVAVSKFKDKIESLSVQGDRLYVGTATGSLHIYGIDDNVEDGEETVTLVETKKALTRRAIDQIGFIKDINSLVVLSESTVSLFPLPTFAPVTPLPKAKAAFSFAIHSCIQHISSDVPTGEFSKPTSIPTLVTQLIVGCRRKVVVYCWKDGEPQEPKEAPLPHSPRIITFLDKDTACFAYPDTEYAIFSIPTMTATDVSIPLPGGCDWGRNGLGFHCETETLILKDNQGVFIAPNATPARPTAVEWPAPPEEIAFIKPYIFSVLPPGSIPAPSPKLGSEATTPAATVTPTTIVQIRSSISLLPTQTLSFPFHDPASSSSAIHSPITNATVRLLTPSASAKSPLFFVTTPTDRAAATAEGSMIWQFKMKSWNTQIDELVAAGQYSDALALLDTIDVIALPDKERRSTQIRGLNAIAQFRAADFDTAIDTLIALDVNPAKVVALYPEAVAGRLSVPQDSWISLFGGPAHTGVEHHDSNSPTPSLKDSPKDSDTAHHVADVLENLTISTSGTIRGRLKGLGAFLPSAYKDDDRASIRRESKPKQTVHDDLPRSVETLLRYLTDRRPKVDKALATVGITPEDRSHEISPLSETSVEELFALPNAPLSALTPEQLLRFAQIVDTALFKSYLLVRPGLVGSLCRISNWCEVSEVEEELLARKKFAELRDLYNGKKMHRKALDLLKHLSEQETDVEDKLSPSIYYLQKLGPEHLDEIFASSRWIFAMDSSMAFQIFTSEDVELPRPAVADYLESIDPLLCIRYLEFLIEERREESTAFHDRLAELYLKMTLTTKKRNDKDWSQHYAKLLKFIDTTDRYRIDRLYSMISSEDLFEARAILLGRFGRHDQALELYVYRLHDYMKAEQHCARVYRAGTETSHLLPPLVTTQDIRTFLFGALRAPVFDTRVIRNLSKARGDQVDRKLMALQTQRVKVTDSRICPQCHKRIGNSFIAVHAPRGEVTHYQCREAFSRRLNETRH